MAAVRPSSAMSTRGHGSAVDTMMSMSPVTCNLCAVAKASLRCEKCESMSFCISCDDMYHRHPKRKFHLRKSMLPPLSPRALQQTVTPSPQAYHQAQSSRTNPLAALNPYPFSPSKSNPAAHPANMPIPPPRRKRSLPVPSEDLKSGSTNQQQINQRRHSSAPQKPDATNGAQSQSPSSFKELGADWRARIANQCPSTGTSSGDMSITDYLPTELLHSAYDLPPAMPPVQMNHAQRSSSLNRRNFSLHDLNAYEQMAYGHPPGMVMPGPFPPPPFGYPYGPYISPWGPGSATHSMEDLAHELGRDPIDDDDDSSEDERLTQSVRQATLTRGRPSSRTSRSSRTLRSSSAMKRAQSYQMPPGQMAWPPPPPGHPYYFNPYQMPPGAMNPQMGNYGPYGGQYANIGPRRTSVDGESTTSSRRGSREQRRDTGSKRDSESETHRKNSVGTFGQGRGSISSRSTSKPRSVASSGRSRYQSEYSDDEDGEDEEFYSVSGDDMPVKSPSYDRDEKHRVKNWTCKFCTYVNDAEKEICEICAKSNPRKFRSPRQSKTLSKSPEKPARSSNASKGVSREDLTPTFDESQRAKAVSPEDNGLVVSEELIREQQEIEQEMRRRLENEKRIAIQNKFISDDGGFVADANAIAPNKPIPPKSRTPVSKSAREKSPSPKLRQPLAMVIPSPLEVITIEDEPTVITQPPQAFSVQVKVNDSNSRNAVSERERELEEILALTSLLAKQSLAKVEALENEKLASSSGSNLALNHALSKVEHLINLPQPPPVIQSSTPVNVQQPAFGNQAQLSPNQQQSVPQQFSPLSPNQQQSSSQQFNQPQQSNFQPQMVSNGVPNYGSQQNLYTQQSQNIPQPFNQQNQQQFNNLQSGSNFQQLPNPQPVQQHFYQEPQQLAQPIPRRPSFSNEFQQLPPFQPNNAFNNQIVESPPNYIRGHQGSMSRLDQVGRGGPQNGSQLQLNQGNQSVNGRFGQSGPSFGSRFVSSEDLSISNGANCPQNYGSSFALNQGANCSNSAQIAAQMAHGFEMIKTLREAEKRGYNADDVEVAINFNPSHPIDWLDENWSNMAETVLTLSNNQIMQNEKKRGGSKRGILELNLVSERDAKSALRLSKGNIWQAIEKCVQRKEEDRVFNSKDAKSFTLSINELGSGRDNMDENHDQQVVKRDRMDSAIAKWTVDGELKAERRLSAKERFLSSFNHEPNQEEAEEAEECLRRYLIEKYFGDSDEDDLEDEDDEEDLDEELFVRGDLVGDCGHDLGDYEGEDDDEIGLAEKLAIRGFLIGEELEEYLDGDEDCDVTDEEIVLGEDGVEEFEEHDAIDPQVMPTKEIVIGSETNSTLEAKVEQLLQEAHSCNLIAERVDLHSPVKTSSTAQAEIDSKVNPVAGPSKQKSLSKSPSPRKEMKNVACALNANQSKQTEEQELERLRNVYATADFGYARDTYECELCAGIFGIKDMVSLLACEHQACTDCLKQYFAVQVRDKQKIVIKCPFCSQPEIDTEDEDAVCNYLGLLDQLLKTLLPVEFHELFQRKVRDRALAKDPGFRWCTHCSSGYIASNPMAKTIMCPDCKKTSCIKCGAEWEKQHFGITCEQFKEWKNANDPAFAATALNCHLKRFGIDCPKCSFHFELSKGGCMHFHCIQCGADFCGGCKRDFLMGAKCKVSNYCEKLGLHAHHPRNCLFYLRDKEPAELEKLLGYHKVDYAISATEEVLQAKGCPVMEQKECPDGLHDEPCNRVNEFAGLCRLHYIEYLGELIMKNAIDPIEIFDEDELELVLRKNNITMPQKAADYRQVLMDVIKESCPLNQA